MSRVLLIVLTTVSMLAACNSADPTDTTAAGSAGTATAGPDASVAEPIQVDPQPSEPVVGGRTLVAVKVDNAPTARPAVGIDRATLLTEVEVEGGMTRFAAFFAPDAFPDVVGPVRSVRPVDASLVSAFASAVVSTGGRPWVIGAVEAAGVRSIDELEASGFQFAVDRDPPHNIFASLGQLLDASDLIPRPWLGEGDWPSGSEAASVTIPFAEPATWEFADGVYTRQGYEVAAGPDGAGSGTLQVETVVVLSAAKRSAGYTDSLGSDVPTFDLVGSGALQVFNGGTVVAGSWSRSAQADPFVFVDESGAELGVPGERVYLAVLDRELTPEF